MGKTTVKSSKSDSKSKKNSKPVKSAPLGSSKKSTKTVLKKHADKKVEKKSEPKAAHPKGPSTLKVSSAKVEKPTNKEIPKSAAKTSHAPKASVKISSVKEAPKPASKGMDKKEVEVKKTTETKVADKLITKKLTSEKDSADKLNGKAPVIKKKNGDKKEEFAIEDDLVGETDDFSSDELSEYQTELENAEEDIEEKETIVEEVVVPAAAAITSTLVNKDKGGDVILTDAEGRRYCRVKDCDQVETVDAYCRYHYLLLWKRIQIRKKILTDGKLERYVEELTSRYPDKFLEVIRRDLRSEKDFLAAIQEMEIDESNSDNDFEDEASNFIDEVRGATTESLVEDDEY